MNSQPKSKPSSLRRFWLIWLTTLALVAGSFVLIVRFGLLTETATIFLQKANGWERAPALNSPVYVMRISGQGVVWVQTDTGLSRLEGASWHRFTASDFGIPYGYLPGHFALDGDEVWGAAYQSVIHFDGKRWRRYPNVAGTEPATSIVAAKGQVWAIDREGNLSHFDGASWEAHQLDLPGVIWNVSTTRVPRLALTADGTLWLVCQGLWRSDGTSWTRVSIASRNAVLLGVAPPGWYLKDGKRAVTTGAIWISDRREVIGINVDGLSPLRYGRQALGLTESSRVYGAAGGEQGVFALATSEGVVWYEGNQWHRDQPRTLGIAASSVVVAPDGSLWGIGYPPSYWRFALLQPVGLATLALLLFAAVYPVWWSVGNARRRRKAVREALLHATGTLSEEFEASYGWKTAGTDVAWLALLGGGYWGFQHYWPSAPTWLPQAAFILLIGAGLVERRKSKPSDRTGTGDSPRFAWSKSSPAILGVIAAAAFVFRGGVITRHFHLWWLTTGGRCLVVIFGSFLCDAYDKFRNSRVRSEIKRGDYRKALEMLASPLRWLPSESWKLLRADALFLSGQAREAEAVLRELLDGRSAAKLKALAFEHLGRVLIAQSRYDDAQRAFEAAIKLRPELPAAYSGLAELRLVQGLEPDQALKDAEYALRSYRASLLERKTAKERIATIRGNQAWALARLGRSAESRQAIEAATHEMDLHHIPEVAGFYWRAGMAMLAVEDVTAAAGHFRRAAELDSQGYYGKLAAGYLAAHGVSV